MTVLFDSPWARARLLGVLDGLLHRRHRFHLDLEEEDSTNLDNVRVREEIFAALVKGYVSPLENELTPEEKQSFLLGAKVMPFMIGLRFLTDYLDGDNYFATKHSEHNLHRARNQFKLYQDVVAKEMLLEKLIHS